MGERTMRIMRGKIVKAIPWAVIEGHEQRAQANHYQTLARLNERGGLSAAEAVAIIEDRRFHGMDEDVAEARLLELVRSHAAALARKDGEPVNNSNEKEKAK